MMSICVENTLLQLHFNLLKPQIVVNCLQHKKLIIFLKTYTSRRKSLQITNLLKK